MAAITSCNAWAGTVQSERAAREECSAYSQAGMRECLAKKANASAAELSKAENKVRRTLAKWDEDTKYVNLAKAKFETSNKEFGRYRDAHCAFDVSLGGGAIGNALEIGRLACVFELNSRRAAQLRDAISDLPLK
ncbi:lysozyme inhibitor LprI family protein [Paraherbaspirillum soli]|uniref:Lysozyme inhibitor LprI family protein n=1 Tax=Paraherbaspirillum soli TaxID=631222 RepID=A0ABW0M9W4_9BURK